MPTFKIITTAMAAIREEWTVEAEDKQAARALVLGYAEDQTGEQLKFESEEVIGLETERVIKSVEQYPA